MLWVLGGIADAVTSVTNNTLSKVIKDKFNPVEFIWALHVASFVLTLPFLNYSTLWVGTPVFWLWLVLSTIFNNIGGILLIHAYQKEDISLLSPIYSTYLIFTAIFAFFILGETPSTWGIVGMAIIFLGVYCMDIEEIVKSPLKPITYIASNKYARMVLLSALLSALSWVMTKEVTSHLTNSIDWVFYYKLVSVIGFTGYIWCVHKLKPEGQKLAKFWYWMLIIGIFSVLTNALTAWGINQTLVSYYSALLSIKAVFAVFIGHFLFKEKHWLERLFGSSIIIIGVIIMSLWG